MVVCGDSRGRSLLLVVVAGTGRPTADLTSKLLDQLWVLLLHLLSELLAPVGAPDSVGEGQVSAGAPHRCPVRAERPVEDMGPTGRPGHSDLPFPVRPGPAKQVHSRLDETGQVVLRGAAARSPQRVVATRNHPRHAARNARDLHQTAQHTWAPPALTSEGHPHPRGTGFPGHGLVPETVILNGATLAPK